MQRGGLRSVQHLWSDIFLCVCLCVCVCVSLTVGAQWYSVVGRRIHEEDWDLSQNLLRHGEHSEAK